MRYPAPRPQRRRGQQVRPCCRDTGRVCVRQFQMAGANSPPPARDTDTPPNHPRAQKQFTRHPRYLEPPTTHAPRQHGAAGGTGAAGNEPRGGVEKWRPTRPHNLTFKTAKNILDGNFVHETLTKRMACRSGRSATDLKSGVPLAHKSARTHAAPPKSRSRKFIFTTPTPPSSRPRPSHA